MSDKKLYEIPEVLEILPMSKAGIYLACSKGDIPSVRVGRRLFIPAWWVEDMTNRPADASRVG
ncbi:MAG: Helix-turn-helix domain [Firmicutes bacterium]|nr:Helix-turn-helix domain [Bacillota bacterium]